MGLPFTETDKTRGWREAGVGMKIRSFSFKHITSNMCFTGGQVHVGGINVESSKLTK